MGEKLTRGHKKIKIKKRTNNHFDFHMSRIILYALSCFTKLTVF